MATSTPALDADRVAWEDVLRGIESDWTTLQLERYSSTGGATLTALDDGSILATGENPDTDTYEVTAVTSLRRITGVRLEVLEDPTLPHDGPGRDPDGNFFLSGFEVEVAPLDTPSLAAPIVVARALGDRSLLLQRILE